MFKITIVTLTTTFKIKSNRTDGGGVCTDEDLNWFLRYSLASGWKVSDSLVYKTYRKRFIFKFTVLDEKYNLSYITYSQCVLINTSNFFPFTILFQTYYYNWCALSFRILNEGGLEYYVHHL